MASARKGVGLVWITEKEIVTEMSPHCVEYGVYNPWDEDVNVILTVSDSLKGIVRGEESELKNIPAGTTHDKAMPMRFCFIVPKVYASDCLAGNFLCEQKCDVDEVVYEGEVVAMEVKGAGAGGAMGSSTALGVSVPLTLKVKCNTYGRDWSVAYMLAAVILAAAIAVLLYVRRGKSK